MRSQRSRACQIKQLATQLAAESQSGTQHCVESAPTQTPMTALGRILEIRHDDLGDGEPHFLAAEWYHDSGSNSAAPEPSEHQREMIPWSTVASTERGPPSAQPRVPKYVKV